MVDDGLELLALDDGQHGGKADDELLLLDDGQHGGMADDDDDLLDALDDLLDADACCLDLDDDDALLAAAGGLPDLADDGASPSATDDATSNPLPNTKRRRVDGAPGGAESRGARPWGRDSPFLPAEDVAIWEFAYDEGGAPAVEHRQRRDPGGQLLWAKALADGKFSRRGAAVRNDAAGRKMLRNRLAYLKKRRDADPDGFEAALDDARAARDALRDGARPDLSESGAPPAADACVLALFACGAPGDLDHRPATALFTRNGAWLCFFWVCLGLYYVLRSTDVPLPGMLWQIMFLLTVLGLVRSVAVLAWLAYLRLRNGRPEEKSLR